MRRVERDPMQEIERHAEGVREKRFQHVLVADDGDLAIRIRCPQFEQDRQGARLRLEHGFPAGASRRAAQTVPMPPGRIALELREGAAAPRAKVDLLEPPMDGHLEPEPGGQWRRGLHRALEGARHYGTERARAERSSHGDGLRPPLLAELYAAHPTGQHPAE